MLRLWFLAFMLCLCLLFEWVCHALILFLMLRDGTHSNNVQSPLFESTVSYMTSSFSVRISVNMNYLQN